MEEQAKPLQSGGRVMAVVFRILGGGAFLLLAAGVWGSVTIYSKTGFEPARIAELNTLGAYFAYYEDAAAVAGSLLQSCLVMLLAGLSFLSAGAACAASRRTPFHEKSPGLLRRAGWLLLAASFLPQGMSRYVQQLLTAPKLGHMSSHVRVSLWGIVLGVAGAAFFFYLARVYAHGLALQRESDETM